MVDFDKSIRILRRLPTLQYNLERRHQTLQRQLHNGVKSVPIEFNVEGKKRRKLRIPDIVEMEIEGLVGSDPNIESKVVNPAFSNTPGYDPVIARSLKHTYKDHGLEWDSSGSNAFYSRFTYSP